MPTSMPDPARPRDEFTIAYEFDVTVVRLAGEVDSAMTGLMDAAGAVVHRRLPVVVDVSAVTFMDSVGCGFLAHLVRGIRPRRVSVVGANREVDRLLRRLQMDTVLDLQEGLVPSEDEA